MTKLQKQIWKQITKQLIAASSHLSKDISHQPNCYAYRK